MKSPVCVKMFVSVFAVLEMMTNSIGLMIAEHTMEPTQPDFSNLANLTINLAKLNKRDTILSHKNNKSLKYILS